MKLALQMAGPAIAFVCLVFWFFGGPNFGRTTRMVTLHLEENGRQIVQEQRRFVPGIDFLGAGFLLGGLVWAGASRLPSGQRDPSDETRH